MPTQIHIAFYVNLFVSVPVSVPVSVLGSVSTTNPQIYCLGGPNSAGGLSSCLT